MKLKQTILRVSDAIINFIVIIILCLAGIYSMYALWDNERIYAAAENVQADMIQLKPEIEENEEQNAGADFTALLEVNNDVCGWIFLDGTQIDYPVLQGETNLTYINRDVYGNFALAGSIYLDSRNDKTYNNTYSLLYGHHMENSKMFGDLDLYKEKDFFTSNQTGILILPDRVYNLEIFSSLLVQASDDMIFDPTRWQDENINELLTYIKEHALQLQEDTLESLMQEKIPFQILALSTCSSEFTDARTIVLAVMCPYTSAELGGE